MKNIFISSTFIDMQAERDLVQERVLPALRDEARKYGDNVGVIDLRWGVDTSTLETEEGAAKVLKVCLDEIDRSHPYMLIFLGERYGTMMRKDQIKKSVRGREDKYSTDDYVKSITALEVEYGALSEKYGELNHCVVCFREPVVHMLDGAEKDLYAEHTEEGKRKLEALKERIKRDLGEDERLITYSCAWDRSARQLVDFTSNGQPLENVLTSCFAEMFRDDWKEYESLSWQDKEQLAFRALMESKLRSFVGREALLEEYYQSAVNGTCPIILQGEVGSGKTAIMCKLVERLQKEGKNVFAFFAGAGSMSTNAESLVKQMVYYMEILLGVEEHFGEENAFVEMEEGFEKGALRYSDWVERLRELCYRLPEEKKVYVCIDALDQMYFDEHVEKLDFLINGKGVQFVASCTNEFKVPMNAMEKRDVKSVPALNEMDAKAVAESILASYSRNTYEAIEQEILKKKSIGSPLYISLLIQRLNMMDAEELRKAMTEEEIVTLGKDIVNGMPDDVDDAIVHVIFNAIEKIGENMAGLKDVINYLAVSRSGLRVQDLQGVFDAKNMTLPMLDITLLMKYLDTFFCVLEDGRINFTHKVIRGGLLKQLDNRREYEENILNYLVQNGPENEMSIKEGMYFARIFGEYTFAQEIISYASDTKNKELLRVIKDVAIEDEGYFFGKVIGFAGENQKKSIAFFVSKRSKVFRSSESERKVKLCVGQAALKVCEKVYEESKTEEDALYLADCLLLVGREKKQVGDFVSAEKYIEKAIEYYEKIQKGNNHWENALGVVTAYVDKALLPTTSEMEREELYARSMTMLDGFRNTSSTEMMSVLSSLFINMGIESMEKGEISQARRCFENAVEYRKQLDKKMNTEWTRASFYRAYELLGDSYCKAGEIEKAKECYDKCLDGREYLYSRNPSIVNLRGLLHVYRNVGHVRLVGENNSLENKQSQIYLVKAMQCAEELYRIEASILSLKELMMICHSLATSYMNETGMEEQCLKYCEKAQKYAEMLYKKEPSKEVKEKMLLIYRMNESVYGDAEKFEMQKYCSDRIGQLTKADERQSTGDESKLTSATVYLLNAEGEIGKGDNEKAIEYSKKVIECIGEQRTLQYDFNSLLLLAESYQIISVARSNMGDEGAAAMAKDKCLAYAKEVKERFPEFSKSSGIDELLEGAEEDECEQQDFISEEDKRQIAEADVLILFGIKGAFDSNKCAEFCKEISELGMECKILSGEALKHTFIGEKYSQFRDDLYTINGLIIGMDEDRNISADLGDSFVEMGGERVILGRSEETLMKVVKYIVQDKSTMLKSALIGDVYYDSEHIGIIEAIASWPVVKRYHLAHKIRDYFKSYRLIEMIGEADLRELSIIYSEMAKSLREDEENGFLFREKAIKYAESLYEKAGDEESLEILANSYKNMGDVLSDLGQVQEALSYYEKNLKCAEVLYEKSGSEDSLLDLSISYNNMGNFLRETGKMNEALIYYEKDLKCSEELYEESGSEKNLRGLLFSYHNMGDFLKEMGKMNEALIYYEKDLKCSEELYEESGSEKNLLGLLFSYHNMGDFLKETGKMNEALIYYEKNLKCAEVLYEKSGSEDSLRTLSISYFNMGNFLKETGKMNEALIYYEKDLKSSEELYEESGSEDSLQGLLISYYNMGNFLKEAGKMNEALIYYEKNLKCTEELGKKIGGEKSLQYLINAYVAIGEVLRNLGREKEAKQYETKATLCKMFFT